MPVAVVLPLAASLAWLIAAAFLVALCKAGASEDRWQTEPEDRWQTERFKRMGPETAPSRRPPAAQFELHKLGR
jgi:hypothetical protein